MPPERPTASPVSRSGLGLAAAGRPGYIDLGRDADVPADRWNRRRAGRSPRRTPPGAQ
ncbi:hypothetical protein [Streptomyces sp. 7N604]|uniref:hypothetical protein n=1 Tax=Streptomyces sp. 7N604 TaxID=3457415 RepID=UPI003FD0BCDE